MFNKANVWRTHWGRKHLIRCCIGYASLSLSIIIAAWILGAGQNRIYAINLYLSPCKIVHCYISVGGFNDFCVFNFLKFKSRTPYSFLKVRKQGETDILLPELQKVLRHTAAKLSHDLGLSKLLFCRSLITNCQEMKSICLQKGFFLSQRRESDLF